MPAITQRMLDVIANQQQYNSNQVVGLANVIAKLFGVQSLDELPPEMQNALRMSMYVLANNFGDQMGLMNQGNLFANMHQAILASGPMKGRGLNGNLLSVSYGSSARSVQVADMMSRIAGDFYANKNGAEKVDNTHGMSARLFEGFAADVVRKRGIKPGDIATVTTTERGSEGVKKVLDQARKAGAMTDSDEYKALVDVYRVTKAREEKSKGTEEYAKIQEIENQLKEFEGKDESQLTDEQKQRRNELQTQLRVQRARMDQKVDKALKGTKLGAEDIDGQHYGEKEITENDLKLARQQQTTGGIQSNLSMEKAKKEIHEALRLTAKNVKDLSEMFGTDDFGELQRMARELGMGSITDKNNVEKVARSIKDAQVTAERSGRSLQSVLNEQGSLMEVYSKIYGGASRVDRRAIERNQRISEETARASERAGIGSTKEESAAEQAAADAAAREETKGAYGAEYLLKDDKTVSMTDEQRKEGEELLRQYREAEARGDTNATFKLNQKLEAWKRRVDPTWNENKDNEAFRRHGSEYSDTHTMARIMSNVKRRMKRLTKEQKEALKQEGTDMEDPENQQRVLDILRDVDNETLVDLNEAAAQSEEQLDKVIEEKLAEAKTYMNPEEYARYEKTLRGYKDLGQGGRKLATGYAFTKGNEERNTLNSQSRQRSMVDDKMLQDKLQEGEEIEKEGLQAFVNGILSGNDAVSNRDVLAKYMLDKGYVGDNGVIDAEAIKKLNEEDSAAFGMNIDEKTGAITNTEVLDKEIVTADGKKMPLWKAMGLGKTREEALKNASDKHKVVEGLSKLDQQGIASQGMGGGNIVFFDAQELDKRKDMLEKQRVKQAVARRKIDAYNSKGERISDAEFDENGNIKKAKIDGKEYEGKDLDAKLKEIADSDPDIQKALDKAVDIDQSTNKNAPHDGYADALLGGPDLKGNEKLLDDKTTKDNWEKLSDDDKKKYGNYQNYLFNLAMRQKLAGAYKGLSGEAKEKFNERALEYLKTTVARKKGESDEDYEKRLKDKIDNNELTTREVAGIMGKYHEEIGNLEGGKEAAEAYKTYQAAQNGEYYHEGTEKFMIDGKEREIDMSKVMEAKGIQKEEDEFSKIKEAVEKLLTPISSNIESLASCIMGNAVRVTEQQAG